MLDALVTVTAALHDLRGLGRYSNSRAGSVYIVKPKQHGPDEVALTVELFAAVEEALGLEPATLKIGIMDEEKRTSLNLDACIAQAEDRVIFVNTGFLDRTGDEIHTDFEAGPVVRKDDMKSTHWLLGYEDRNVDVALRAGFAGPGPGRQGHVGQARGDGRDAGAPRARSRRRARTAPGCRRRPRPPCTPCTTCAPTCWPGSASWPAGTPTGAAAAGGARCSPASSADEEKRHELETNAQSILGYVVRWVGLGIGCSTVPDLDGRRTDGGPRHAAHLQPADRQLAAPRAGRRGAGAATRSRGWPRSSTSRTPASPATGRWPRTSTAASRSRPRWSWCSPGAPSPTATPSAP